MITSFVDRPQRPASRARNRARPRWAAPAASIGLCLWLIGIALYAALRDGGYFPDDVLVIGALAYAGAAAGLMARGAMRLSREALIAVGALAGFTAWTGLSASWSPDPGGADLALQRDVAYLGVLMFGLVVVGDGRHATLLVRLVLGSLSATCGVALITRLRPDWIDFGASAAPFTQGRLSEPIGYWNGLAAIASMTIAMAAAISADRRTSRWIRVAAGAAGVLGGTTLYLTLSRGGGLALAVGLTVMLALSPRRLRIALATVVVFAGSAAAISVVHARPSLVNGTGVAARQLSDGRTAMWLILAIALLAGVAQLLVDLVPERRPKPNALVGSHIPQNAWASVSWLIPIAVVLGVLVVADLAFTDTFEGHGARGTMSLRSFASREYHQFMQTGGPTQSGAGRLTSVKSDRFEAYRVALRGFRAHPFRGDGAAGYRYRWLRQRKINEAIRNAHSLELETLSDLGVVGGVLLVALLAAVFARMGTLRRRTPALSRAHAAAAGGAFTVWAAHSALDWDWQLGGVTLPALIAAAVLLGPRRRVTDTADT